MRPLFMSVYLTKPTKFLVRVRSFIKRMMINEFPAEQFTNCSMNIRFICTLFTDIMNDTIRVLIIRNINRVFFRRFSIKKDSCNKKKV
ncbi:hypothetical protein Hanom_Chr10g00881501 [Helianthus anomalus]